MAEEPHFIQVTHEPGVVVLHLREGSPTAPVTAITRLSAVAGIQLVQMIIKHAGLAMKDTS